MTDTLVERSWPSSSPAAALSSKSILRGAVLAVAGSMLIAICAHIAVPMWPVPMTMQTFAVLLIGMAYGARLGAATVALYLAQGAAGLPVFAAGGGLAYFAGPTAGYLFGFVLAAAFVGMLAQRGWDKNPLYSFVAMAMGTTLIFIFGVAWLSTIIGWDKAVAAGLMPFLAGAVVKTLLGAMLLPFAHKILDKARL